MAGHRIHKGRRKSGPKRGFKYRGTRTADGMFGFSSTPETPASRARSEKRKRKKGA